MAGDSDVALAQRQAFAGGYADAGLDDVDAGDHLGHAVLDLHAGVHLHEIEVPRGVEQELDRAGALVAGGARRFDGGLAHALAQLGRDGRRGRLFDQLLVAALDGAVALAQVDGVALAVREDLDLDVARLRDVLLDVHGAVAEGGLGLAAGLAHGGGKDSGIVHDADALAAAPCRRLDHDRQAHGPRDLCGGVGVGHHSRGARRDRHAGGGHGGARHGLVAHRLDRLGARPDEGEVVVGAQAREGGALGQKAVAGVNGVGAVRDGGHDEVLHDEIALRGGRRAYADGLVGVGHVE